MKRSVDSRRGLPASTRPLEFSASPAGALRLVVIATGLACFAGQALAATATKNSPRQSKQRVSFDVPLTPFQPSVTDPGRFSFTAPGNPASSARLQTVERAFRFTPSGQSENHKALSLGVSSRVVAAATDHSRAAPQAEALAALPAAYNVDVSVAWKGFAVNTGYTHIEPGVTALLDGRRQSFDIGVSYRGRNWTTSLQGTAQKGGILAYAPLERRYSVELGGAYSIAPRFSVTGGVRYSLAPESPSLLDIDRADQAVYFGTAFSF